MRFPTSISTVLLPGVLAIGFSMAFSPVCASESAGKGNELLAAGIQAENQDNLVAAEAAYESCLRQSRETGNTKTETLVLHRLAILNAKRGRHSASEKLFRQAVHLDPTNTTLLCDFAKLFTDQKKYRDAETVLKNAALAEPDFRRTLFNLGLTIASQEDRQTEGLRYLKLALGEVLAYRELAKICEASGNSAQAEYALQRAAILEHTEPVPSAEVLKMPKVAMDESTKNELVEHIKRELLRQESVEIAEEVKKDEATAMNLPVQQVPVLKLPDTKETSASAVPASTEGKPSKEEKKPEKKTSALVLPRLVPENEAKTETVVAKPPSPLTLPALPVIAPPPAIVEPPAEVAAKDPEPPVEPTITQGKLKNLPAPEYRISNSTDNPEDTVTSLPVLVLPLDDKPRQGNLPEYTAIGIKRIPVASAEPMGQSDAKVSLLPADTSSQEQHETLPAHPPVLTQPVDLISMDTQLVTMNSMSARSQNNTADGTVAPTRMLPETAPQQTLVSNGTDKPEMKRLITEPEPAISKNRLRAAGIHDATENYVHAKRTDSGDPPQDRMSMRAIQPEPIRMESRSRDTSNAAVSFRRTPSTETPVSDDVRRAFPEVEHATATEVAEMTPAEATLPERAQEERSELQFSSNRAPNVMRFELAQNAEAPAVVEPAVLEPEEVPLTKGFNEKPTLAVIDKPAVKILPPQKEEATPRQIEVAELDRSVQEPQKTIVPIRETASKPTELREIPSVNPMRELPKQEPVVAAPEPAGLTAQVLERPAETFDTTLLELSKQFSAPPTFEAEENIGFATTRKNAPAQQRTATGTGFARSGQYSGTTIK